MSEELMIMDGQVVSMEYVLHVDGEIFEESQEGEPLEFIQGEGHIIPGLEDALYGMLVGDKKSVVVAAEDGYGEIDADAFVDVPRKDFPDNIPLEVGVQLQVQNQDGTQMHATIDEITDSIIRLDFNHPLAGKELTFDIQITSLRQATDEELDHGHVHGEDHDYDEEEE